MKKPRSFEKLWRKRFENFASNAEDDAGIAGWSATGLDARLRKFKEIWNNHPELKKDIWLDAGCGAGTYTRFIAEQGADVVGLDYSYPSIQKAKSRSNDSIAWCVADINKIPLQPQFFEGVICFGVTQALNNSSHAIHGLTKMVKPGGYVCIDALNSRCLPNIWEQFSRWILNKPAHLRYETKHNMHQLMRRQGLTDIQLHWLPILPSRYYRYQWIVETRVAKWIWQHMPSVGQFFCHAFILCGRRSQD
ncbi:MAG: class I SAM-dependent methyltransferase [Nitrosomonas sp.]|nr:class I SAM-dependent methyltransferase [Nitrosomonas sp.]